MEVIHHVLGMIFRNVHPEMLHVQLRDNSSEPADMIVVRVSADNVFDGRRAVHRPDVLDDRLPGILKAGVDHDYPPLRTCPIAHRDRIPAIGARSDRMKIQFIWHRAGP
jgi:hypothetical protein